MERQRFLIMAASVHPAEFPAEQVGSSATHAVTGNSSCDQWWVILASSVSVLRCGPKLPDQPSKKLRCGPAAGAVSTKAD